MEYQFAWDGWTFGAAAVIILSVAISRDTFNKEKPSPKPLFAPFLVIFFIGSVLTLLVTSSNPTPPRDATVADVMEAAGIKSGTAYPLILGDFQDTGEVAVHSQAGLFSSSTVFELKPSEVVTIGYEYGDLWWRLHLPTDNTPFRRGAEGESPSVRVWFTKDWGSTTVGGRWENKPTNCKTVIRTIWPTIECEYPGEALVLEPWIKNMSLPQLVDTYFSRAEITLTPEQHAELFKTN